MNNSLVEVSKWGGGVHCETGFVKWGALEVGNNNWSPIGCRFIYHVKHEEWAPLACEFLLKGG